MPWHRLPTEKFVAEPFEEDVPELAFNLCANAMAVLSLPYLEPTRDGKEAIQPLLDHILQSLVSGNQHDYRVVGPRDQAPEQGW